MPVRAPRQALRDSVKDLDLMIKENDDLASHISVPKPGELEVHRRRHRDNKGKILSLYLKEKT